MMTESEVLDDETLDDVLEGQEDGEKKVEVTPKSAPPQDDLKAAMAELAGTVTKLATPRPEPKKELTQDEKDEMWAVFNPEKADPKFLDKFFRLTEDMTPEQRAEFKILWSTMQQGLVKQSIVGARNLMQIELAKLREEFDPIKSHVSETRAERTREKFFTQYSGLGEKKDDGTLKYSRIINNVAAELASQDFPDEKTYFKTLADRVAEVIKEVIPEFDLGAVTKTKPAGTSPKLPRTSAGGTGGTGNGTQTALRQKGDATDEFLEDS